MSPKPLSADQYPITPVQGEAWVKHLGLTVTGSPLGRVGRWGANKKAPQPKVTEKREGDTFILTGADLYRLDCRACHGPNGEGAPPVINALIGPARASSAVAIREDMKKRGFTMDEAMAKQLAVQGEKAIRHRLEFGGTKMPAFAHLQGVEVDALLAYLHELAGVPGAAKEQMVISEPAVRVGEHLVKGTCHTCHDSTGPGSGLQPVAPPGQVPSLASLMRDRSVDQVVRKVLKGTPIPEKSAQRGEMPVFRYLTRDDIIAVYDYLATYPPKP
ncbi:MAG TPA: c-type cytochrome [Thermoanaerobaculia bacterium]|nr:c-type cytochrome [Thermoanaerobaculia bacterium]